MPWRLRCCTAPSAASPWPNTAMGRGRPSGHWTRPVGVFSCSDSWGAHRLLNLRAFGSQTSTTVEKCGWGRHACNWLFIGCTLFRTDLEKSGCIMTRGPGGVKQIIFQGSKRVPEIFQSKWGHARWHGMVDKHSEVVREIYRTHFICANLQERFNLNQKGSTTKPTTPLQPLRKSSPKILNLLSKLNQKPQP